MVLGIFDRENSQILRIKEHNVVPGISTLYTEEFVISGHLN